MAETQQIFENLKGQKKLGYLSGKRPRKLSEKVRTGMDG
jgi:hypothetical protein